MTTEKLLNSCEYRKTVRTNSEKFLNQCEYRNIVESRLVTAKAGIRASTEKQSGPERTNGRISVSTGKLLNTGEYKEKVESVRVP